MNRLVFKWIDVWGSYKRRLNAQIRNEPAENYDLITHDLFVVRIEN